MTGAGFGSRHRPWLHLACCGRASTAFARVAHSQDWERVRTIDDMVVIFRSKRY